MHSKNNLARNPGCESKNHTLCYGELWQCSRCGKTVCEAEGSDEDPDLCDDCWYAKHHPPGSEDDIQGDETRIYPKPTTETPDMDAIAFWIWDGVAEATDGCITELDGVCPHGHRSWLRELGIL